MFREPNLSWDNPKTPEEEEEGEKKMYEVLAMMKKNLPGGAGFKISPTNMEKDVSLSNDALKYFDDKELIEFIQNKPEIVNKILTFQRLLEGKKD